MSPSPRAAIVRLLVLLLAVCAAAFAWERAQNAGARHLMGRVVGVERVAAGRGGDGREFTIRYRSRGRDHDLVARRGILDALDGLRELRPGDRVPLAVRPGPSQRAVLDTLSGRYPVTLSLAALTLIFLAAVAILALQGRLPRRRE